MSRLTPTPSRRWFLTGLLAITAMGALSTDIALAQDLHPGPSAEEPATQVKLRDFLKDLQRGQPQFDQLEPITAEMIRQQLPMLKAELGPLGPLQSLTQKRSEPTRGDTYLAIFANGTMGWRVGLTGDGKIEVFDINTGTDR